MNITRTIIAVMMSGALLSTAACGDLQGGQPSQAPQRSEEEPSATTSVPSTTRSSSLEAEAQTTESSPPEAKTTGAETPKNAQAERAQEEEVVIVKIRGLKYLRSPVTVAAGTTVRWVNEDVADHTVTSEDSGGPLRSEAFGQGGTFKHRFREVGEFAYYCEIHPFMKASVIVK